MSLRVQETPSPNHDDRPTGQPVDMLILHYTGMQSGQAALDQLRDPGKKLSSHYVVEEDGQVWRLVPEDEPATLGYMIDDYVGHMKHHLSQIP